MVGIYNHFIANSPATFDLHPYSVGERVPWFSQFAEDGPHQLLVADREGDVAGFAASTRLKERPGYNTSVETTVYVAAGNEGQGIGSALYDELLKRVQAAGIHAAFAGIALPNEASVKLHEKYGFKHAGTLAEVGYKFDRFIDVAWFQKHF